MAQGYGRSVTRTDSNQFPARSTDDADVAAFDATSSERMVDAPIEGAPSDNTTMTEVLNGLRELGFTASFTSQDDALLHCDHCDVTSTAASFEVVDTRHLEGASDPDDLVTLVAARAVRPVARAATSCSATASTPRPRTPRSQRRCSERPTPPSTFDPT